MLGGAWVHVRRAVAALWFASMVIGQAQAKELILAHAVVVNPSERESRFDQFVRIAEGRIVELGSMSSAPASADAIVVDLGGRYVIPGMWDMHTHNYLSHPEIFLGPLYVANGVTGVRDMGDGFDNIRRWRDMVARNAEPFPRIVAAGPFVDGPRPLFSEASESVASEADAIHAVRRLRGQGADFIKVQSVVPRTALFALLGEAERLAMPVAGHIPIEVDLSAAAGAGFDDVQHFTGFMLEASSQKRRLRREMIRYLEESNYSDAAIARVVLHVPAKELLTTFDAGRARRLVSRLRHSGVWQTPTFTMLRAIVFRDAYRAQQAERMRYVPSSVGWADSWLAPDLNAEDQAAAEAFFAFYVRIFAMMREGGLDFLAGTDVGFPGVVPGFSLHDELQAMVDAGASPREALVYATSNPARYLGLEGRVGVVAVGAEADIAVLDGNPLEDISAVRRVHAVVLRGRLYDRAALDALLDRAASQAGAH